jgi:phosphoglycerate dehydrogenase-like enzyme
MTPLPRIALLDDTQGIALSSAPWSRLKGRADVFVFHRPFADEDEAARALEPFDVLVPMRERTPFPASLIAQLPNLRLIAMTGGRAPSLDAAACERQGVTITRTVHFRIRQHGNLAARSRG